MRKNATILLLLAGIVLTLAGCQKGTTPSDLTGKAVRFAATSESLSTRTSFTGAGTQDGDKIDEFNRLYLTHERINWKEGDQVMIASDNATVPNSNPTMKYATYTVASFTEDGNKSYATLEEKAETEELYFTDEETYKFWGIYPASFGDGSKLVNAQASYAISGSQAPDTNAEPTTTTVTVGEGADAVTKNLKTFAADMSQAVMLAAAEGQTAQNVDMEFYPGFTAFEFTLNSAYADIILHDIVLKPASASKSLAGSVDAEIKKEKGSTFAITYPEAKELTYTFPEGTTITKTDYVTFTVFAVPETIEGLTLVFHLGEDGSEEQTATLKMREGNETKDISFTGCKKHYLRGIAVKGGWNFKYLTLDIDVMDWVDLETTISSGEGVQSTQFNIKGADNLRELKDAAVDADSSLSPTQKEEAKEANKAYRQWWVFPAGNTVTVTYKIMMPLVGTWKVEPLGDTDAFSVTSSTGSLSGNLAGASATATYITLTITSNATDKKSLYLKTTVTSGGETYNLDSETQLYDMRGYHYFIVNGDVNTNAL